MSGDLSSSNNDLLKKYSATIMQDSWLEGTYSSSIADQKSELKKIFTVVDDNNVTASQKKTLQSRAEVLKDKVERLEAEMAVLAEEIEKSQEQISKAADSITDLVSAVDSKSKVLEKQTKANTKNAIEDVFYEYKRGLIGKDAISSEISKRIRNSSYKLSAQTSIENLLSQLDSKQAEVQPLVDAGARWADQMNLLESKFGVTKSAYDLINANLAQIGNTNTNYTNSDFDAKVPTYSLEKTDIVSDLFANTSINVQPGKNANYSKDGKAPTVDSINEKYKQYFSNTATKGVDANSSKNKAVTNLGKAVQGGLLSDLASLGLNGDEISEFLAKNFSGANIKYEDGKLSIPYGHDAKSKEIFGNVKNFISNPSASYQGALNTWDPNKGNTISSNKQLASLAENYENILDIMSSDPKFTFKEAMYALFNKDTGLFKDCGINFDLEESAKEGGPSYSIDPAGDAETAKMYQGLAAKIKDIWGVGATRSTDLEQFDEKYEPPVVKRTDPITFKQGDTEFAFIVDRDGDGTFDDASEFLGGKEGSSWLDDLKALDTDGDGKLTGDELKNLKLLSSAYTDNAETTKNKEGYLRSETTDIAYSMTDADALGIGEIDLNDLEQQVNKSTGQTDINGSEIFNDSFSFNLNGQEVTATRKDDTDAYMDTVYSDAYGKNFKVGLSEDAAQQIIDNAYSEASDFTSQFNETMNDIGVLKNAGQVAQEARNMYNDTMNRIQADENVQLLRASNKAAALNNAKDWSTMQSEIRTIAAKKGINIDMEQAKGIYVIDGSLSANEIVQKYQDMVATEQKNAAESAVSSEAWSAISLCAKNDIQASSSEIMELLSSGKAKTAQDVVDILKEKQAK